MRPDTESIREQVKVTYESGGKSHDYFFDMLVKENGGRRIAYAVKATERDVIESGTEAVLEAIRDHLVPPIAADDYRILTQEGLDPLAVLNARLVIRCGRDHDLEARETVLKALAGMGAVVTLREVASVTGLGTRGVRATVALVQSGSVRIPVGAQIGLDMALGNREARAA